MGKRSTQLTDKLIADCLKGDRKSQKQLYDNLSPEMYAFCFKFFKNKPDADDALQEGFIRLFNKLDTFRHEGPFAGWARRIFVCSCIELSRKNKHQQISIDGYEEIIQSRTPSALDNLYHKDLVRTTTTLSDGYHKVFMLYTNGYSHKEIGEMLNITESTSKSQYSRAKSSLRHTVSRYAV